MYITVLHTPNPKNKQPRMKKTIPVPNQQLGFFLYASLYYMKGYGKCI